jgi:hypothetical protein
MYLPNYVTANVAPSQTDSVLVAASSGVAYRVIGGSIIIGGTATNVTLNSKGTGAGTAITSQLACGINGGISFPIAAQQRTGDPPFGYFETNRGEGLTVNTGAGSSAGITLVYIKI